MEESSTTSDLERRDLTVGDLLTHVRQQAAVAELGRRALRDDGPRILLDEACALTLHALDADGAFVLERAEDGMVLQSSAGLRPGAPRHVNPGPLNPLLTGEPVAIEDIRGDPRMAGWVVLPADGMVGLICVGIAEREGTALTLAAFTRQPRLFEPSDLDFLQGIAHVVGAALDRERALQALRTREQRFRALIEHATDGIALFDEGGRLTYVAPSFARILGHGPEDAAVGLDLVHPDDRAAVRQVAASLRTRSGESLALEHRVRHADGSWRWIEATATNLLGEPAVEAVVANFRDVTERHAAEEQIRHQAHHDALTGLPNRVLFEDRLVLALSQAHRAGRGLAVLFVDLDHLKRVNDARGHAVGDAILQAVALRLRSVVRETDTVARRGGDEFVVVLPNVVRGEDAARMAHKILLAVGRPFEVGAHRIHLTASIGIALYPMDGVEPETLLKNADNALYLAKDRGRNRYQLCTPEMNALAGERLRLEQGLRGALEREELRLYYQPEVDVATGQTLRAEALLRWEHPELGLLSAGAFVPLAESSGLISAIGEWALRELCSQVRSWQETRTGPPRVAMNVSGVQFQPHHLARLVDRVLREVGPDPRAVELEVAETVAMRDVDATRTLMHELSALGVGIAIDAFGTGYSSLAALKRFPIQTLKIDRSFVTDVATSTDDAVVVRAIITMAHALRLKVVAEGVETAHQLAFLRREACDVVQGYYLGYPVPAAGLASVH
jgi:diguanylate cyclase (GGDEF)-like protein/PAS domain S-box-containing protein